MASHAPATATLRRQVATEFVGTAALTSVVVGSGRMATALTTDRAVALLLNDVATVAALGLLIWALGPVSGAHFNPVVTLVMRLRSALSAVASAGYVMAQTFGAVAGAVLANLFYDESPVSVSTTNRGGTGQLVAEAVATAGLVAVICIAVDRGRSQLIPVLVPAWIASAYLFTSSTSFANPAVTVGRIFTDSFAGIAPSSVGAFIVAQVVGALIGVVAARAVHQPREETANV